MYKVVIAYFMAEQIPAVLQFIKQKLNLNTVDTLKNDDFYFKR